MCLSVRAQLYTCAWQTLTCVFNQGGRCKLLWTTWTNSCETRLKEETQGNSTRTHKRPKGMRKFQDVLFHCRVELAEWMVEFAFLPDVWVFNCYHFHKQKKCLLNCPCCNIQPWCWFISRFSCLFLQPQSCASQLQTQRHSSSLSQPVEFTQCGNIIFLNSNSF